MNSYWFLVVFCELPALIDVAIYSLGLLGINEWMNTIVSICPLVILIRVYINEVWVLEMKYPFILTAISPAFFIQRKTYYKEKFSKIGSFRRKDITLDASFTTITMAYNIPSTSSLFVNPFVII